MGHAGDTFADTLGWEPVEDDARSWRDALFGMLVKIRDICEGAGIPMHLHGVSALAAWRDGAMWDTPMLCIDIRDARRFADAIEAAGDEHLRIANMTTDAHFPTLEHRVYDPATISFDALQAYKFEQNCLHVRIRFFLHLPPDGAALARAKKIMGAYRKRNNAFYASRKVKDAGLIDLLGLGEGASPAEVARATFDALLDAYSGNSGRSGVVAITGKQFDEGFLDALQPVELLGETFQMPADAETYLSTMLGENWRARGVGQFGDGAAKFRDTRHAWSEFAHRLDGIELPLYGDARERHRDLGAEMKPHDEAIARYYALVSRTHQRFALWSRYMPRKDELAALRDAGDYDGLERALAHYLSKLEAFHEKGLGLCFDPDIFEMAKDLLAHRGRGDYAAELDSLVPPAHRAPIAPPPPNPEIAKYHENQQALLYDMLARLLAFMEERGIVCYLLGGTCIGAVRHEGFIPWDDDIDLIIDRPNYKKLVAAFAEHPFDDMELNCYEFDDNWRRPFAQLAYTGNAVYLKTTFINRGKANGTRIDIMILDDVPIGRLDEFSRDLMFYQEVNMDAVYYNKRLGRYIDDYIALKDEQEAVGRTPVVNRLLEKVESYGNGRCDKLAVRFFVHVLRAYDASWFKGERFAKFEDIQARIPAKAEACMRLQYGYDWYRVPAGADNLTRSHGFQYSWEFPGERYQEDLERFIDIDDAERVVAERKKLNVKRTAAKHDMENVTFDLRIQRILMHLALDAHADDLHRLFASDAHDEFMSYIAPLAAERKSLARVPMAHKRIPAQVLADWVAILVERGEYFDAEKLLRALEAEPYEVAGFEQYKAATQGASLAARRAHRAYAKRLEQGPTGTARKVLDPVLRLADAYQDGDLRALEKALRAFGPDDVLRVPDVLLAQIRLKLAGRLQRLPWTDICAHCEVYLERHPGNQDVRKGLGDVLWECGERDRARELYVQAHAATRNGLDILAIEKRLPDIEPRFARPF